MYKSQFPKFYTAQSVPYTLKEKIEDELSHLVKLGIYQPILTSQWSGPIVPVFKSDKIYQYMC